MLSSDFINKKLTFTLAVLLFSLLVYSKVAQSQPKTVTKNQYLTTTAASQYFEKTSKLLKRADEIRRNEPIKFQEIINKLASANHFTIEQRHLYNFLVGYGHTFNGEFNKAEKQLTHILTSSANQLIKFRARHTLIHVYAKKKMWFEGLALIDKNLIFAKKLHNRQHVTDHLITTAIFYTKMKQYELSLHYIKELSAQALSSQLNCIAQQLTIESKFHLKQLTSNDPTIYAALNTCEEVNDTMVSSIIRAYLARAYLNEQNTHSAINSLLPYWEEVKATHYPELISGVSNTLAEAYWQANDIVNSKYYAEQALANNINNSNVNQAAKTYKLLYKIAKLENGVTLALSYHEQYAALDKIDSDDIENKHLAFQLAKNKNLVQQSEIALLSEKNNLLIAKQELAETKLANRHLFLALLIFIIIILTLFGLRLWRDHKRVKELAEYDQLTGIFNRGHFTQVTLSALKYCQNATQDLSMIMFDLDHFKKINDNFGHLCGDWALKEVTKACQAIGRQNDIFARLGGEEFCIVLPSCNIQVATLRAEACRAAIEAIITQASGYEFTITASFGVTDVRQSGFNLDKLLADSDAAAYQSKHAGRNRVTVHQVNDLGEHLLDSTWGYN